MNLRCFIKGHKIDHEILNKKIKDQGSGHDEFDVFEIEVNGKPVKLYPVYHLYCINCGKRLRYLDDPSRKERDRIKTETDNFDKFTYMYECISIPKE